MVVVGKDAGEEGGCREKSLRRWWLPENLPGEDSELYMANARTSYLNPTMISVIMVFLSLLVLIQKGDAREFKVGGSGDWSLTNDRTNKGDAREFKVGGSGDWSLKSTSYNQWAEKTRFQVGDIFEYQREEDSVLEVSKDDYNNCNTASPIAKYDDGRTLIRFNRPGPRYFISGVSDHCKNNEKTSQQSNDDPMKRIIRAFGEPQK
ncbi:cupredoxin [Artemisia annua]|uniref:Cupredoxin n=1 Tax=Artemisia annua TaxID=35608 RepID=A0A2U1PAH9_ARTAN|nr:cupredoxin [Artemisia annua]